MNYQENDEGFVLIANEILRKCKINGEVQSLKECSDSFFVAVYEGILGESVVGIITNAVSHEQRISNCEKVIDALSHDVLNVDLSHITAANIVDGDITTIQNLLEIFKELLDFILDVDDEFDIEDPDHIAEQNDSNLLSSDHEVISDVLERELGPVDKRFPSNLGSSGAVSSDASTIGEPELSSIPKCSDAPSSRNSDNDSNSTNELIRESDLLEQQLSRDYLLLKKLREARDTERHVEPEKDTRSRKEKLSDDKHEIPTSTLPTRTRLGGLNSTGGVGGRFEEESKKRHESRDVRGEKDNQKNGDVLEHRGNLGRINGVSNVPDNEPNALGVGTLQDIPKTINVKRLGEAVLGNVNEPKPGGRFDGISEAIDNAPRLGDGAIRNDRLNIGTSRNVYMQRTRSSDAADSVHRLDNSFRRPVTIPTSLTERNNDEFALGRRTDDVGRPAYRGESSGYRDYIRENDKEESASSGEKVEPRLVKHDNARTKPVASMETSKPDTSYRKNSVQDTVTNLKGLSMRTQTTRNNADSLLRKSKFLPQEETTVSSLSKDVDKQTEKSYRQGTKTTRQNLRPCEAKTKDAAGLSPGKTSTRDDKATKEGEKLLRGKSRSRMNKGERSPKDGNGHGGGKKGKENKRPQRIVREQGGTMEENEDKERKTKGTAAQSGKEGGNDSVEKGTEATEVIKEHTDGSESSGVFWDDQISPLDISERLRIPSQGLAFDEVGLGKKSREYEARQGLGRSKDSRDSPVIRHYHHHFHHGSSEDLVRDVDMSERARHVAGSTNVPGLGSSFGRKGLIDRDEESSIRGKEAMIKKDDKTAKKRSVKFDDHVDALLITNRLERLRREMELEDDKENERTSQIRNGYDGYLNRLNQQHRQMEKELRRKPKKTKKGSPYRKKASVCSRDRARTNQRKARYPSTKARKRSSSTSPKIYSNKRKAAKQLETGDVILPTLLDEFPFLHVSPHTLETMRRKQTQQLTSLSKSAQSDKRQTKTQKVIEDAEKRQQTLLKILRKDLQHNQRMREQKERSEQERSIKSKLREKRHATARARRYYEEYQLRMRARMLKRRTREEQIFKNLFEDGLEIQKQRVRELRTYAKEQRETRAVRQQNELESLENYYRDQYSILTEAIAQEKEALLVREKAQEKVIQQMQRNLREKLQKEVTDIQETLVRDEDDAYFRRLDAERLRRQLQMTAFQNLS